MQELSPLDGRYRNTVEVLRPFFSEEALMRARVTVEIRYFMALADEKKVREVKKLNTLQKRALQKIIDGFKEADAKEIKTIERRTRHDVKSVEYFLRKKMARIPGLKTSVEFIHFGLTSEDVNNLAYGILIHEALTSVVRPDLRAVAADLSRMGKRWMHVPMLSLTHGQPATPTTVGKELMVFVERLGRQFEELKIFRMDGKFGGAVGNFSAHRVAYPDVDWHAFGRKFVRSLGLIPLTYTTQINSHDDIAELSHVMSRINTILLDLSRDCWFYISRGVFTQKVVAGEVGSSTMPHKVNPIDFENAEGNAGLSTALFIHFAKKLPVSRLQRDLSDSTVQRNIGVAFGHHKLAVESLRRGLGKLALDRDVLKQELQEHPEVIAEAVQTLLRKHGVEGGYEQLKKLTRGRHLDAGQFAEYIKTLPLPRAERMRLIEMLP